MQRSIYLAKLIGPPFIVAGIGMLFNGAVYRAMSEQFLANPALIYLSGVIVLPVGIAIVLAHNVWTRDWQVIITIFGWLGVIGGVTRMLVPQLVQTIGATVIDRPYVMVVGGIAVIALGCVLSYCGYADLRITATSAASGSAGTAKTAASSDKPRRTARQRGGK
jgi:hypothetical protein